MTETYGKVAFYPGCALDGLGKPYEVSIQLVANDLGLKYERLDDYNCCGALEVKNVNTMAGFLLPARNLSLANRVKANTVMSACPGCHYSLSRTHYFMSKYVKVKDRVNFYLKEMGELPYENNLFMIHVVEFIRNAFGPEKLKAIVKRRFDGLKVAPYYGCLYVRPKQYLQTGYMKIKDDPERPVFMDELLQSIGAEPVQFEAKVMCCGGPHVYSDAETSMHLEARIIKEAVRNGAELLITDCPLGHVAIETNMTKIEKKYGVRISLVYFTQLLALALGHSPEEVMLDANITRPMDVLKKYLR
ncbi:disulfide reductase [Sulfolobales archaeon HS-7]|nr:disulfide reductase [Sulfolobales archaeon HS-7]